MMRVAKKKLKKSSNDKFLWWKKIERDVSRVGVTAALDVKAEKKRQRECLAELEKVKKRRAETAGRNEELFLQRERAKAAVAHLDYDLSVKKEDAFVVEQSLVRYRIRFRRGAAKPIDILTLVNHHEFNVDDYDQLFKGLSLGQLEELYYDIQELLNHHVKGEFWEAILVICEWKMREEATRKDDNLCVVGGVHPSVETDVRDFLQGISTYKELLALQSQIESEMRSGKANVVEYWEAVLRLIPLYKAKMFLKDYQHENSKDFSQETMSTPELEDSFDDAIIIDSDEDSVFVG
ncbi:cactin-like [Chenopodium quinoa]|uniref:Splicing factor cactin central domain-containing protein n=1 Tax=Chenopodium quinoa TaxID=63459 RepID=A0A803LBB4_CHEQI|nr:cactin-like [Chenopodium quinoa]